MITKICIGCGVEFEVENYRKDSANYCSKQCYWNNKSSYHEIKKCLFCKTEFKVVDNNKNKQFCSLNCYRESKKRKCLKCGKETKNEKYCSKKCYRISNKKEHNKICKQCKNEFKPKYPAQNKKQEFCGRDCYWKYIRKNKELKYLHNLGENSNVLKICKFCGCEFEVENYRKDVAKFCSKKCKHESGRIIKLCPVCHKEFTTTNWENFIHCSLDCCNKSGGKRISKWHKFIFDSLNRNIFIPDIEKCIKSKERKTFVDIFVQNKNVILECNGDYWHCNPQIYDKNYFHSKIGKTAEEIWKFDKERKEFLEKMGYKVIVLWESDFEENEKYMKKLEEKINEICKN